MVKLYKILILLVVCFFPIVTFPPEGSTISTQKLNNVNVYFLASYENKKNITIYNGFNRMFNFYPSCRVQCNNNLVVVSPSTTQLLTSTRLTSSFPLTSFNLSQSTVMLLPLMCFSCRYFPGNCSPVLVTFSRVFPHWL